MLTGGTAHMGGFAEELERLIGVTVRVGDPLMRVRVGKDAVAGDEPQIGSYAIAIGLGSRTDEGPSTSSRAKSRRRRASGRALR